MANFIIEEFDEYKATIHDSNYAGVEYSIQLHLPDGEAQLRFQSKDFKANHITKKNDKNLYNVYYKSDKYYNVIDLLRNEGPLYFFYNLDTGHSYLTTGDEPVGEGEGHADAENS